MAYLAHGYYRHVNVLRVYNNHAWLAISAIARRTPMQGYTLHLGTCEIHGCKQCKNKINILSLRSNSFPFFQANGCSLASLICEAIDDIVRTYCIIYGEACGLRDQRTIEKPKPVLCDAMGRFSYM